MAIVSFKNFILKIMLNLFLFKKYMLITWLRKRAWEVKQNNIHHTFYNERRSCKGLTHTEFIAFLGRQGLVFVVSCYNKSHIKSKCLTLNLICVKIWNLLLSNTNIQRYSEIYFGYVVCIKIVNPLKRTWLDLHNVYKDMSYRLELSWVLLISILLNCSRGS